MGGCGRRVREACVQGRRLFMSCACHFGDSDAPPTLQTRKLSPWEVGPLAGPRAKGTGLATAELT